MATNLLQEIRAMLAPIVSPVGITFAQRDLESTGTDFGNLVQGAFDEFPSRGQFIAKELGVVIQKRVENRVK